MTPTANTVRLADVAEIELGKAPVRESIAPVSTDGVPLIARPSDLGDINPKPAAWTTDPVRLAHEGDLIMSVRGANLGGTNQADRDYAIGRGIAAIRPADPTDSAYLQSALQFTQPVLEAVASGSAIPSIQRKDLEDLELPWPPSRQRSRIAGALDATDRLARHSRNQATRLQELAHAIYDLLTTTDRESLEARVPLGDLARSARRPVQPTELPAGEVESFSFRALRGTGLPEIVDASTLRSQQQRFHERATLLSLIEPQRWSAWIAQPRTDRPAVCSPELLVLAANDAGDHALIAAAVRFDETFREQVTAAATGATPSRVRTRARDALRATIPALSSPRDRTRLCQEISPVFDLEHQMLIQAIRATELHAALLEGLMTDRLALR